MTFRSREMPCPCPLALLGIVIAIGVCRVPTRAAPAHEQRSDPVSYSRDVRPVLSENCFFCHGQDAGKRKGKLRLDTEEGQRSKGVVVPGEPGRSEIVRRIFSDDPDERMPPPDSKRHLTEEQKEVIRRWVAQGAKFERHWAFVAPTRTPVPRLNDATQPANPVDAFIRSKLPARGLAPSPEAPRETLIRRVYLDLIGLPPTPDEIDAFVRDGSPAAYEKVVDRLLADSHYGERMALPWLDAARYADSNGFQQDGDTYQWVWRDWVVRALNENMPFDRFTIEQLAGDLLPRPTQSQLVATAFNRNHLLNGEGGAIPEEQRFVILFDRVDVTATNWLGLTMACAQCHDHKYDPVTQRDYYSLMAAFNNVPESGVPGGSPTRIRVADPVIDVVAPEQQKRLEELQKRMTDEQERAKALQKEWQRWVAADESFANKRIRELITKADAKDKADRDREVKKYFDEKVLPNVDPKLPDRIKAAEKAVNEFRAEDYPRVMVMSDGRPRETFVLGRGNYLSPTTQRVSFATPAFLPPMPPDFPKNRLGLAKWLVSPEQPLTARVIVNRMWQTLMGTGLVKTGEDFGVQGEPPVHQDLLDWLAVEFRESGWDMKHVNRLIVTSRTYRQSSRCPPELLAADPENKLYARSPRFRLPAMILRDLALSASGLLDDRMGGKPVYPYQPEGVWESLAITKERDFTYPQSRGRDLYRRSLYTFWRRTVSPTNMFDASNRQACRVRASTTNTPLHALTTLNDVTWVEAARVLAECTINSMSGADARLRSVVRRLLGRVPDEREMAMLRRMLAKQRAYYAAHPDQAKALVCSGSAPRDATLDVAEHAAWTAVCLAVFNLDEALTRE
jgi:hypothetical protein